MAQANNIGSFACPHCAVRQPIGGRCPTNWLIKSHIDGLRNAKVKRKRDAVAATPSFEHAGLRNAKEKQTCAPPPMKFTGGHSVHARPQEQDIALQGDMDLQRIHARGDDDHRAQGFGSRLPIVQRFVLCRKMNNNK